MSNSWRSTIRLPKSTFPPRPASHLTDLYIQRCTTALYEWQLANRPTTKPFLLHDGPPYANGALHVGHALNKILKDIILRVKIQQGHRVTYVPGWDCHGLPIELKALEAASCGGHGGDAKDKNNTTTSTDMTPVAIRAAARALASRTVLAQMAEFQSYAVMADWAARWTTMDPAFELRQLELFLGMVRRGLIYRRYKPVYWSPSSRTALAEAELEYSTTHHSTAAYVKLVLERADGQDEGAEKLHAVVWTTTPWTLPANRAVAVHDDLDYAIVRHGPDLLVVANECVPRVAKMCFGDELKDNEPEIVRLVKGSELRDYVYRNPLQGDSAAGQLIIHADFVSAESGSGLVHLAPGHGHDDYEVCKPLGVEISAPVDDRGHFTAEAYPQDPARLEGMFVQGKGNAAVLEILGESVLKVHKHYHKYPYDWRTNKPIIVRATAQWFADVASIKERALDALMDVDFIPASGKNRLAKFVQARSEWCISRQRAWGVPIPALYNSNGDAVMTEDSVRHIISVIRQRGTDAWWSDEPSDAAWIPESLQGGGEYRRGTDTMDVWFDSGSSWTHEGGTRADVYLEGSDQHRGWFQSSLLTRVAYVGSIGKEEGQVAVPGGDGLIDQTVGLAPFKRLITHGFTLDRSGKKMSKSKGNITMPNEVMQGTLLAPAKKKEWAASASEARALNKEKAQNASKEPKKKDFEPHFDALGADALRLWAASSDYTHDVIIGSPVLVPIHKSLIKYRTILKMILGAMLESARRTPLTLTDHIAVVQLQDTMKEVGKANDKFEFYKGFTALNRWVNNELSAFYLEAVKDRLYCGDGGGVLEPIFLGMLRMLAPITPMLVEEAWDHAPEWLKKSVAHPQQQLSSDPIIDDARLPGDEAELRKAISVLEVVHAAIKAPIEHARKNKHLGSSLACSIVLDIPDGDMAKTLEQFGEELEALFVVSSVGINVGTAALPAEPAWKHEMEFQVPAMDGAAAHVKCKVWVLPPKDHKCPRCWRYVAPVEDETCERCSKHCDVINSGDVADGSIPAGVNVVD